MTERMQGSSYKEDHTASLENSEATAKAGPPHPANVLAILGGFSNPTNAFALHSARGVNAPGQSPAMKDPKGNHTSARSVVWMQQEDNEERLPDWKRFVLQQSSKIGKLTWPSKKSATARVLKPGDSFGQLQFFSPVADVVMGVTSVSTFDNESRKWTGKVSSLNSGGSFDIRAKTFVPLNLTGTSGIQLTVRGDGIERRFKFKLFDNDEQNIYWSAIATIGSFTWAGNTERVRIPYSTFRPTLFGDSVSDAKIDLANIMAVQFCLSQFDNDGDINPNFVVGAQFELDVVDVGTY